MQVRFTQINLAMKNRREEDSFLKFLKQYPGIIFNIKYKTMEIKK